MWTKIEEAIKAYSVKTAHMLASKLCLSFFPTVKESILPHLNSTDILSEIKLIFVNTPSIAQYWPTQHAYKYLGKYKSKRKEIFIKCGIVEKISKEVSNIQILNQLELPVPRIITVFKTPKKLFDEDKKLPIPLIREGMAMVEEFLPSVSLGHALTRNEFEERGQVCC